MDKATPEMIADEAMRRIWLEWYAFYRSHFRNAGVSISLADQMAFYEISQPILRSLAALAASPPPAVGVPDGWKLVPVEPTKEMLEEGYWPALSEDAKQVWETMLEAAPAPPAADKAALVQENERLRAQVDEAMDNFDAVHEHADALQARLQVVEAALKPFAWVANLVDNCGYEDAEFVDNDDVSFHAGDFRRARAALDQKGTYNV